MLAQVMAVFSGARSSSEDPTAHSALLVLGRTPESPATDDQPSGFEYGFTVRTATGPAVRAAA